MRIVLSNGQVTVDPTSGNPATIAGETQIALRLAGVCETDLQLMAGYMAFDGVLGHEFVGEAMTGPWAGRRVVGEINCACRQCRYCERGQQSHCPHRTVLGILKRDGAFATQFSLPQENLHLVPDNIPDEIAVLTEPVAAALRVAEQIDLAGKTVLVVGDGRLGSLCAATLHPLAKELSVAGKHPAKLEFARSLGLTTFFKDQLPEGRKWDVVIETTGRKEGLAFALPLVEPEGTLVLKTTVAGPHELSLAPVVIDEIRVIGSRCGPFAKALVWLKSHGKSLLPLIEQTYPLAEGVAALEHAQRPGTRKILLKP
ncbi:MAG: alcohol dehydrogenase [Planctomyces sp.]|nr:alcohol dehydrogenase [Planctomyces sp.]